MNLKGRNFLTLKDFTPEEITYLIDLAAELKAKKHTWIRQVPRSARKRASQIQQEFSEECTKESNTEVSVRRSSKNLPNTQEFRYGMV